LWTANLASEIQPEQKLNLPPFIHGVGNLCKRSGRKLHGRLVKLRVVKEIDELRAELERPFASSRQPKRPANGEVPVVCAVLTERVVPNVAPRAWREIIVEVVPPEN
jgi:hypothetical protein